MLRGFKNFIMRRDIVVVAVGLIVALAFSTLIKAFTDSVINPILARAQGSGTSVGLGWQLGDPGNASTYLNIGTFISAVIYFIIFMAIVYFLIVLPYKLYQQHHGRKVFEEPGPTKECPACLSDDIPAAARKCRYCGTDQPTSGGAHQV